jgi:ELWxxDGT repeat protein
MMGSMAANSWISDGTEIGTYLLADILPGTESGNPITDRK